MTHKNIHGKYQKGKTLFKTDRLLAREWTPLDARNLYLLNTDPEVLKYTGDRPFSTEDEARIFLENYKDYKLHGFGRWLLLRRDDGACIGWCGLKMHDEGWVDLGFRLMRSFWGQGYATEAAKASLEVGFHRFDLPEIIGRAAAKNTASHRVLEKLKMTFWQQGSFEGIPHAVYYRITKEAYHKNYG